MINVGTDFSGIGSPEQALKNLGIDHKILFACEIDKFSRKSYEAVHGMPERFYNDITKRDHSEVERLDLYVAGFPCQAFSMAGKRKGFEDIRGTLFFNVAEFIKENQPEVFILENVKGLMSHDNGRTFQTILNVLSNGGGTVNGQIFIPYYDDGLGYHIYYSVLNTKDFGVPQNRERVFIIGFRNFRQFSFPVPEVLKLKLKDVCQSNVDDKYFLSDKMLEYFIENDKKMKEKGIGFSFEPTEGNCISKTVTTKEGSRMENNFLIADFRTDEDLRVRKDNCSPCVMASFRDTFKLNNTRNNPPLLIKSNTKQGFEVAEDGDCIDFAFYKSNTRRGRVGKGISQTIDTACNMSILKDCKIRRLTPLECWRLQAFPDEAFFKAQEVNSDTQLYKQAGNSISVNVMEAILKKIYKI